MKGRYLFLNLVLAGMIIACNLSNTVVENAISKTETAQPTATITLIPTGTPVPTPIPTSEPLPAVIPATCHFVVGNRPAGQRSQLCRGTISTRVSEILVIMEIPRAS